MLQPILGVREITTVVGKVINIKNVECSFK